MSTLITFCRRSVWRGVWWSGSWRVAGSYDSSSISTEYSITITEYQCPSEQPDQIPDPVVESPTRKFSVAPEPVSKSPVKIPVAVSDTEPPPQIQHQSETVPRNSPWKLSADTQPEREKPQISLTCDFKSILRLETQSALSRDVCFVGLRKFQVWIFAYILVLLGFKTNELEGEEVSCIGQRFCYACLIKGRTLFLYGRHVEM